MTYKTCHYALSSLTVYRHLLDLPATQSALALFKALDDGDGLAALDCYNQLFFNLKSENCFGLDDFLLKHLKNDENLYADMLASKKIDGALVAAAQQDISRLAEISAQDWAEIYHEIWDDINDIELEKLAEDFPPLSNLSPFDFEIVTHHYETKGCGIFAQYRTFLWENGGLVPVPHPDCPRPIELMGYSLQRNKVYDNTRSLMEGNRVNNVLLFGNGGTGKSATVKSMLYQEGFDNLRLIEIAKEGLENLSSLTRLLGKQSQKFILFIDDLAFDKDDKTYSSLKSILEGGLEPRPKNVAVYATSNRRHLVKQTISERAGDEMDTFETIAEKTALADRFGLRIPYLTMNKVEFLQLVSHLAGLKKLKIAEKDLHAQAMTWEIRHGGRTPRTAQQFISSLK